MVCGFAACLFAAWSLPLLPSSRHFACRDNDTAFMLISGLRIDVMLIIK